MALAVALALCVSACGDDDVAKESTLPEPDLEVPGRDAFLDGLVPDLLAAIERKDTDHVVFHGCYDWHSAVHGHWAILRIDLATKRHQAAAERVAERLSDEGLRQELALLDEKPVFEMPYGRAWFLRLAVDYERWATMRGRDDARRLRPVADDVLDSLRAGLRGRMDARTREYANVEWAIAQMAAFEEAAAARSVVTTSTLTAAPMPDLGRLAADHTQAEFFSPVGNWLYAQSRDGEFELAQATDALTDEQLAPVVWADDKPTRAHHYGMNWSRAWAFAAVARAAADPAARDRFARAYREHVEVGMRVHAKAKGDYDAYGHWVPQFAVYALTPEFN